jgi:hypothetical protein
MIYDPGDEGKEEHRNGLVLYRKYPCCRDGFNWYSHPIHPEANIYYFNGAIRTPHPRDIITLDGSKQVFFGESRHRPNGFILIDRNE